MRENVKEAEEVRRLEMLVGRPEWVGKGSGRGCERDTRICSEGVWREQQRGKETKHTTRGKTQEGRQPMRKPDKVNSPLLYSRTFFVGQNERRNNTYHKEI